MACKVRVNKNQLNYFRRLARDTDLEIQAYLVGEVKSPELTIIKYFAYTHDYHTQTTECVRWYEAEYQRVKKKAEEQGLRIVGTIHSHPNWWPVLSECDHNGALSEGERISGVCSTMNRKTCIYFWVAESSLPCRIEYAI